MSVWCVCAMMHNTQWHVYTMCHVLLLTAVLLVVVSTTRIVFEQCSSPCSMFPPTWAVTVTCVSLRNLRNSRGFTRDAHPEGEPCNSSDVLNFRHLYAFLRRPWAFSRALGCGARRRPACTLRRKFGPRAGSVGRALGVQSREVWQVITGLLSAELREPSREWKNSCFAPLL